MKNDRSDPDLKTQSGGDDETPEQEFSFARSSAFVPLMISSAIVVVMIFGVILTSDSFVPSDGVPADKAFGPASFPTLFEKDVALVGLESRGATAKIAFPVPVPPFSEGIFPCTGCHAFMPANPERRELTSMHGDIVFEHDAENRWCLDCHDQQDRDQLRMASGSLIPFTESYKLCGQCHGTQYRDWRSGIHGKRTGYWNGSKRYLLCVHCHNPHSPRFKALKPLPPPIRPQFLRREDSVANTEAGSKKGDG